MNKDTLRLLELKYNAAKTRNCVNIAVLYALKHDREFKDYLSLIHYVKGFYICFLPMYFDCSRDIFYRFTEDYILKVIWNDYENNKEKLTKKLENDLLSEIDAQKRRDLRYDKRATEILFNELFEANNIEHMSLEQIYDGLIVKDNNRNVEQLLYEN